MRNKSRESVVGNRTSRQDDATINCCTYRHYSILKKRKRKGKKNSWITGMRSNRERKWKGKEGGRGERENVIIYRTDKRQIGTWRYRLLTHMYYIYSIYNVHTYIRWKPSSHPLLFASSLSLTEHYVELHQ